MLQCNFSELDDLRSQIATANLVRGWNHKRCTAPMMFTENGVAMLSSVLKSKKAIDLNIEIMRTFTKLRSFLMFEKDLEKRFESFEEDTKMMFRLVFEKLDQQSLEPIRIEIDPNKKKIGIL